MTKQERQKKLDEKKWLESEKEMRDMSGMMEYCDFCDSQSFYMDDCEANPEERVEKCLCATAYNRMKRAKK